MATKHQKMQTFIRYYREVTGEKDVDMHKVAKFAAQKGWKLPVPKNALDMLAKQFSAAAREETRYDEETNRPYRANHYFTVNRNGESQHLWLDIDDDAPRHKMKQAVGKRREQMVGEGLQLTLDVEHWNRINPAQEPLQVEMDLRDEIEWRKNAEDATEKAS